MTEEQLDAAVDFLDPNKDGSVSTYVFIAAWIPFGMLATEDGDPTLLLPVAENRVAETHCSLTVLRLKKRFAMHDRLVVIAALSHRLEVYGKFP